MDTKTGNGPASGSSPPGFNKTDFAIVDCSELEGSDFGGDPLPQGSFPYLIGTAPEDWVADQDPLVVVTASALTYGGAHGKLQTVADNGPGSELPSATEVEAYVTIDFNASGVTLYSSLAQRFATYTVELDGQVIADKESGLNASLSALPQGWVSVASEIPAIPAGSTIVLTQRRLGAAEDLVTTLAF